MSLEWEYEPGVFFYGNLVAKNGDFDHAFGTKKQTDFEIEDFRVLVFIGQFEYAMKFESHREESFFKEQFLDWALRYEAS